jgi:hypothetical protein
VREVLIRVLYARLATYRAEALRCRLDRLYCETTGKVRDDHQKDEASEEEIHSLQAELQSLYPEIISLAEMSAQQEHVKPILSEISQNGQSIEQGNAAKLEYVSQCFAAASVY